MPQPLEIEKVLVLSTRHMLESEPEFNSGDEDLQGVRCLRHDYGYILFLNLDKRYRKEQIEEAALWLRPILELAFECNCSHINFDRDGSTIGNLPTWNW